MSETIAGIAVFVRTVAALMNDQGNAKGSAQFPRGPLRSDWRGSA